MRQRKKTFSNSRRRQEGAVSLFVVIFAAIFLTITTVGFVQTMLRLQQQATDNDLAQSAYDSALAGVEDAKKAINRVQQRCAQNQPDCDTLRTILSSGDCNTVKRIITGGSADDASPVIIKQTEDDADLNQAYTCVTVDPTPSDIQFSLMRDQGKFMKLQGAEGSTVSKVRISWGLTTTDEAELRSDIETPLSPQDEWGENNPALLRAQFIDHKSNFVPADFDNDIGNGSASSRTAFLYPSTTGDGVYGAIDDIELAAGRYASSSEPLSTACEPKDGTERRLYPCAITIQLPSDRQSSDHNIYLYLLGFYNNAQVRVQLLDNSDNIVAIDNGHAIVDSTGRANDLFRRVSARVEPADTFPYPKSALEVESDLCKDFVVTDAPNGYNSNCIPGVRP